MQDVKTKSNVGMKKLAENTGREDWRAAPNQSLD
jgi:hypothetical protein